MKILVVEDDLALSAGLCFELDMNGYITVAAYNCQKVRQLVQNETFDLAILDVNLPDGNGFELCREMRERCPDTPVIFLTANDLEENILKGYDLGAEDYITKPFNIKILLKKVDVALRHSEKAEKKKWRAPGELRWQGTSIPTPFPGRWMKERALMSAGIIRKTG